MKRLLIGALAVTIAGCSRAPESSAGEPDIAGNSVAGIAFDYSYNLSLPSSRIADLQEDHARACEQLGTTRCRITGLGYTVDGQGDVSASLAVKLAAPLARKFGRDGVKRAESLGATLTGADISGTDVATAAEATSTERVDIGAERARVDRELARTGLKAGEREQLRGQQAALIEQARSAQTDAAAQRDSLANTPMSFTYRTGRGTGLIDRLRDAGDTALGSVGLTVTALLWVLAALGPPFLVLAALFVIWIRWGEGWWTKLTGRTARKRSISPSAVPVVGPAID
ncbi:MAG TPA: hypothetical protein VNJ10_13895 [Sphingomonas sp.]|nr:hypothetical protein [Sphingomonas sp.]